MTAQSSRIKNLQQRARIVQSIRAFFIERDFLEVETPQRLPCNAPEVYIEPIASEDWQLQTSPELAMKRLLAAGCEKIFQICHCWRAAERGAKHLPEFTMLEWYRRDADYNDIMSDCEELLRHLVPAGALTIKEQTVRIDLPFERLPIEEAFLRHAGCTAREAIAKESFDEQLAFKVEPNLGMERPTILYDYPAELAALARTKKDNPEVAERFELYIAGTELANAFSELTDRQEQTTRFEHDSIRIEAERGTPAPLPRPFLRDLDRLDQAAGIAFGVDRLVMLLTGAKVIDDVIAFPPEEL